MTWKLLWRQLLAHPFRSLLTFGSITVAMFLLCFLRSTVEGLQKTVTDAKANRLMVQSAVSLFQDLPLSYEPKIAAVDGVEWVCKWQWFGGVYIDESNFFAQFGIDPATLLKSYPEMAVTGGSYEAFAANRTGCLVGEDLATTYGWKLGDRIPIKGTWFAKLDGSAWEFTVEGIYRSSSTVIDQRTLFFHFDYLNESIKNGAVEANQGVGVYMLKVRDGTAPEPVMAAVDALFQNGPQKVQTTTEAEFNRQFVSMLGNVPLLLGSVGAAVLFAIFFAVLNTMLMAGHERTRQLGILKALGFSDASLALQLLAESLLLCVAGGLCGIGLAKLIEGGVAKATAGMIAAFEVSNSTILLGLGIAVAVGLFAGFWPAVRAARLTPVRALRAEM